MRNAARMLGAGYSAYNSYNKRPMSGRYIPGKRRKYTKTKKVKSFSSVRVNQKGYIKKRFSKSKNRCGNRLYWKKLQSISDPLQLTAVSQREVTVLPIGTDRPMNGGLTLRTQATNNPMYHPQLMNWYQLYEVNACKVTVEVWVPSDYATAETQRDPMVIAIQWGLNNAGTNVPQTVDEALHGRSDLLTARRVSTVKAGSVYRFSAFMTWKKLVEKLGNDPGSVKTAALSVNPASFMSVNITIIDEINNLNNREIFMRVITTQFYQYSDRVDGG